MHPSVFLFQKIVKSSRVQDSVCPPKSGEGSSLFLFCRSTRNRFPYRRREFMLILTAECSGSNCFFFSFLGAGEAEREGAAEVAAELASTTEFLRDEAALLMRLTSRRFSADMR